MSNSRKMKRSIKRNVSAVGIATVGTVTVASGLMMAPGIASATVAGATENAASSITNVYPGLSNQPAGSVSLTVPNTFTTGDVITLPILVGSTPTANGGGTSGTGDPTSAVTYSALPTITVTPAAGNTGTADTTPAITATLTTNPNDSNADRNAGIKDEVVLTFTNNNTAANGTTPGTGDTYTVNIGGVNYNVGTAAGSRTGGVPVYVGAYNGQPNTGTALSGSPQQNATIQNYRLTEVPNGVPTGSTNNALNNFAISETVPGVLGAGEYTLAPSAGMFSGSATITATGLTVAAVPTSGVCPTTGGAASVTVTPDSSGYYHFCIVSATSTTPGSLTVSGMHFNAGNTAGPVNVTLYPGASASGTPNYQTTQPAITQIVNPRVAGYTADDTAAQAAEAVRPSGFNSCYYYRSCGGAVILASDAEYQDALSASFLGNVNLPFRGIYGYNYTQSGPTPILLNPADAGPGQEANTAAVGAIRKLNATTVYIIGGTAAISQSVEDQLKQIQVGQEYGQKIYLNVVRIAGVTAEQTAAEVAQYPTLTPGQDTLPATPGAYGMYNTQASESPTGPTTGPIKTAILADANEFQDALAASPLAYSDSLPVLLNAGGQGLDSSARAAIANMGIQQVIVVGGKYAVSDQAVSDLIAAGVSVLRVAGITFSDTAAEVASFELNNYTAPVVGKTPPNVPDGLDSPSNEMGPTITVGTSRGDAYQDALASAQLLGTRRNNIDPLLLNSDTNNIGGGTAAFLTANGTGPAGGLAVYGPGPAGIGNPTIEHILGDVVFGGTLAQTPGLVTSELNDIAAG